MQSHEFDVQKLHSIPIERSGLDRYEKISTFSNIKPIFLHENDKIEAAVYKIIQSGHRSIPIVSNNHDLAGIVTTSDILNSFLQNRSFNDNVNSIMSRSVIFVNHDDSLGFAIQKMKISRRERLPVLKNKKLVGMVGEYDIMKYFAHNQLEIPISDVMTKKPLFINPNISIFDVTKILANTKYRRLPVVEDGRVVGIVTTSDVLKYLRNSDFKLSELFHPLDNLLRKKVFSVEKHKDLSEAIRLMLVHDVSGILVADNEKLEGIITERDVIDHIT